MDGFWFCLPRFWWNILRLHVPVILDLKRNVLTYTICHFPFPKHIKGTCPGHIGPKTKCFDRHDLPLPIWIRLNTYTEFRQSISNGLVVVWGTLADIPFQHWVQFQFLTKFPAVLDLEAMDVVFTEKTQTPNISKHFVPLFCTQILYVSNSRNQTIFFNWSTTFSERFAPEPLHHGIRRAVSTEIWRGEA